MNHNKIMTHSPTGISRGLANVPNSAQAQKIVDVFNYVYLPILEIYPNAKINSAFRSPAVNRAVGGEALSYHLYSVVGGQVLRGAVDIGLPGRDIVQLARGIHDLLVSRGQRFDMVLGYPERGFVHVQVRFSPVAGANRSLLRFT